MLGSGRSHVYAASFRLESGRWVVAVTGVVTQLHHQRRSLRNRHQARVGVDLGVRTLAVACDEHRRVLHTWVGVKALQHAQGALKLANQSYSRTKRDSAGRKKAAVRLGRVHARVARLRGTLLHGITTELARGYTCVTIEDLTVAGMLRLRSLARYVSDAAFGAFRRPAGVQGRLVRHAGGGCGPVVPVVQDVLGVRGRQRQPDVGRPGLRLRRVRAGHRPGHQRRGEPRPVHPTSTQSTESTAAASGRLTRVLPSAPGWAGPRADCHPATRKGPGSEPAQDHPQGRATAGR